jgi:hypothetical protein
MQGLAADDNDGLGGQGIEAAYMIRKGQGLGITRRNLYRQSWLFGALLGVRQSAKSTPAATPVLF